MKASVKLIFKLRLMPCVQEDIIYSSVSKGKVQDGGGGVFSKYTHVANRLFITKLSET